MSRDAFNPPNSEETSDFGIRDTVSDIKDRATGFASKVREKAGEVGSTVSETVGRQRENAAGGLDRVASTIHENAGSLPGGQKAARAAHSLADGMESTASYLREHDFKTMGDDLMGVCRRHPAQALISALAIGFLMGRAVRRS